MKGKENQALKLLHLIYKDEKLAKEQLTSIKSTSSNTNSFSNNIRFILQWKVFQRFVWTNAY